MIDITDAAARKIKEVLLEENIPDTKLRMAVQGGGCSGLRYDFTLDDQQADDDFDVEKNGIHVLVDAISAQYVQGSTIDFKKNIGGGEFIITNPNSTGQCGCGSSFAI
jgi:iron-sulfur cluster insertion protein